MVVTAFWYGKALSKAFGSTTATGVASFDWLSDTIKVALLNSSYVPSQDSHATFSQVDSREVTGTGYTAGGATLANKTLSYTPATNVLMFDNTADTTWATSAITARFAVIYKAGTAAATSPLLGYVDFGANVVSSAGTFTIAWAAGGIFTITPA
jgi:hypothetical protein